MVSKIVAGGLELSMFNGTNRSLSYDVDQDTYEKVT